MSPEGRKHAEAKAVGLPQSCRRSHRGLSSSPEEETLLGSRPT